MSALGRAYSGRFWARNHHRLQAARVIPEAMRRADELATLDEMIKGAPEGSDLRRRLVIERERLLATRRQEAA